MKVEESRIANRRGRGRSILMISSMSLAAA